MNDELPCLGTLSADELREIRSATLGHYRRDARSFWAGTRDHDVSQNIEALIRHLLGPPPHTILDFGCGPGRDLAVFRDLGYVAVGLEGADEFVRMAREHSGCEVLHQDFLALDLGNEQFDGVFANASLFHVPSQELPRVLSELWTALKPAGTLFSSNPHGPNREGWSGDSYGCYLDLGQWRGLPAGVGFAGGVRERGPRIAAGGAIGEGARERDEAAGQSALLALGEAGAPQVPSGVGAERHLEADAAQPGDLVAVAVHARHEHAVRGAGGGARRLLDDPALAVDVERRAVVE